MFEPKSLVKSTLKEIARVILVLKRAAVNEHSENHCSIRKKLLRWFPHRKMALMMTSIQNVTGNISYAPNSLTHPDNYIQSTLKFSILFWPTKADYLATLSTLSNYVFPFLVVFFDSSSSCLLVWTGICCQTVVRTRCERQRWRQGEIGNVFFLFFFYIGSISCLRGLVRRKLLCLLVFFT